MDTKTGAHARSESATIPARWSPRYGSICMVPEPSESAEATLRLERHGISIGLHAGDGDEGAVGGTCDFELAQDRPLDRGSIEHDALRPVFAGGRQCRPAFGKAIGGRND